MMELLTVIAILAVLIAIIIPVFSGYLEKSREAVDLANVRSAYSEVAVAVSVGDKGPDRQRRIERSGAGREF